MKSSLFSVSLCLSHQHTHLKRETKTVLKLSIKMQHLGILLVSGFIEILGSFSDHEVDSVPRNVVIFLKKTMKNVRRSFVKLAATFGFC